MLVNVDAKMDITQPPARVFGEGNVAAGRITAEGEAHSGIFEIRRQSQDNGVVADTSSSAEILGIVFEVEIGVDVVGRVTPNNELAIPGRLRQLVDLVARILGIGI